MSRTLNIVLKNYKSGARFTFVIDPIVSNERQITGLDNSHYPTACFTKLKPNIPLINGAFINISTEKVTQLDCMVLEVNNQQGIKEHKLLVISSAEVDKIKENKTLIENQEQRITELFGKNYQNLEKINSQSQNIEKNSQAIIGNATRTANNTAKIEENTNNIAKNKRNIEQNTTNIANNGNNIATSARNITSNTHKIATNTSKIAQHSQKITAVESKNSEQDSKISTNENNIKDLLIDIDKGENLFRLSKLNPFLYSDGGTIIKNGRDTIFKGIKPNTWSLLPISNPTPFAGKGEWLLFYFEFRKTRQNFGFEITSTNSTFTRLEKKTLTNTTNVWKSFLFFFNTGNYDDIGGINLFSIGEVRRITFMKGCIVNIMNDILNTQLKSLSQRIKALETQNNIPTTGGSGGGGGGGGGGERQDIVIGKPY